MTQRIPHSDETVPVMHDPIEYHEKLKKRAKKQFKPFLKRIQTLGIKGRYLEIGAGPGILASAMANNAVDVQITAIELFSDMIDLGKKQVKETGTDKQIHFVQGNVEDESFMTSLGKYDLVYSTFSLHHWKNPVQALKWMVRTVKKNGTMIIFDFKRVWWLYYHPKHNGFLDSVRASYTRKEIKKMFAEIGIQKVQIITPFPFFWHIITVNR